MTMLGGMWVTHTTPFGLIKNVLGESLEGQKVFSQKSISVEKCSAYVRDSTTPFFRRHVGLRRYRTLSSPPLQERPNGPDFNASTVHSSGRNCVKSIAANDGPRFQSPVGGLYAENCFSWHLQLSE